MKNFSISNETIKRIEDKILWCLETLQTATGKPLKIPSWSFKQIGRTAGKAFYFEHKIELNPDFINNGNIEYIIEQTLPHEIAHLVSVEVYGPVIGRGHKWAWKHIMRLMGLDANRCHNLSTEGVKTRKFTRIDYRCNCCGQTIPVTKYRHNQILSGRKIFHTACGRRGTLTLIGMDFHK